MTPHDNVGRGVDCEFSTDEEALRATVRRFLGDRAPVPYVRQQLDDPRGTSDEVWKGLAALGVTGLLAPGAGGMVDMGVVLEELGRAVHPGPFLSSAVGAMSAVMAAAPDDDLIAGLADGSVIGTVVLADESIVWDADGADVLLVANDGEV